MAELKISTDAYNYSVDLGSDEEALQMMRDALERDPLDGWALDQDLSPTRTPSRLPRLRNWQAASETDVVNSFAAHILRISKRNASRRKGKK